MWSSFLGRVHSPTDLDQGTTLLVNTTLKFAATARLDGKLSVKAMNALEGPCLAFKSDAFVAASAELHFANCHNIVEYDRKMPDEVNGGAMNVRGSLMVMGTLTIRDCRTKKGHGGSLGSNYSSLSPGIDDEPQKVDVALWDAFGVT